MSLPILKSVSPYLLAVGGLAALTALLSVAGNRFNATTVALVYLLSVLFLAAGFGSRPALFAAVAAMLFFNFFFLPPVGTFTISDTENLVALGAFLIVAVTAGQLSAKAKRRAEESERLYEELQTAFEKASEAEAWRRGEKLKSALLDAVTHDLRTPLTSIKAAATMLIEEHAQQDKDSIHLTLEREGRGELLEVINEETDRLNDFIQAMVEVARLEAGEFHLRKTRARVEETIAGAVQRARKLTANHEIELRIEENLPALSVDSKAVGEVVYNLLGNAAKYSPPRTRIEIAVRRASGALRFSVEDEGAGVAAAERERVFRKFYRADTSAKGFGMGLAIARGIVEAHGGQIWIESGRIGSRFAFDLPLERTDERADEPDAND